MRSARRVASCGALLLLVVLPSPARAQDVTQWPGIVLDRYPIPEPPQVTVAQPFRAAELAPPTMARRPAALMPLYGTLAVLEALDVHSTMRRVGSSNGREANPVMVPVVRNGAAFVAVKVSATLGVIWMSEKMWRKHRKAAVVSVFVVNAMMAGVVANNYRVNR